LILTFAEHERAGTLESELVGIGFSSAFGKTERCRRGFHLVGTSFDFDIAGDVGDTGSGGGVQAKGRGGWCTLGVMLGHVSGLFWRNVGFLGDQVEN